MSLRNSIRGFAKDESGLIMAETLILLPMLIWGFLALFVYWDAFRAINISQKAAYSISDLLSRQGQIDQNFINGMQTVANFLVLNSPKASIRITSIQYDGPNNKYLLLFSKSPGNKMAAHTAASIQLAAFKNKIPTMLNLDSVVVVETEVEYHPGFDIGVVGLGTGITDQTFRQFIVTRPRFYTRVCMNPTCTQP